MDDSSQSPYANLYEEAGQKSPDQSSYPTEEICPLYIGLKRIDIRYTSEEPITFVSAVGVASLLLSFPTLLTPTLLNIIMHY